MLGLDYVDAELDRMVHYWTSDGLALCSEIAEGIGMSAGSAQDAARNQRTHNTRCYQGPATVSAHTRRTQTWSMKTASIKLLTLDRRPPLEVLPLQTTRGPLPSRKMLSKEEICPMEARVSIL